MAQLGAANDLHHQPLGDLVRLLAEQAATLARQEAELAKAELREQERKLRPTLKILLVAAAFAFVTLSALTTLVIVALSYFIPAWAAALGLTVLAAVVTAVLVRMGRQELRKVGSSPFKETIATLKENLEWAKLQRISVVR